MTLLRHGDPLGLERSDAVASPFWLPLTPDFAGAVCAQVDADLWFGETVWECRKAVDMCFDCPHMIACGKYAIDNQIKYGVWGGYLPSERLAIIKGNAA